MDKWYSAGEGNNTASFSMDGKGGFSPPSSNEAYGTSETPLIQTNGNGVSDLLYTLDFAFLGLHEATAA